MRRSAAFALDVRVPCQSAYGTRRWLEQRLLVVTHSDSGSVPCNVSIKVRWRGPRGAALSRVDAAMRSHLAGPLPDEGR
jgi:hypothetical protein